jgi:hypothetical protein
MQAWHKSVNKSFVAEEIIRCSYYGTLLDNKNKQHNWNMTICCFKYRPGRYRTIRLKENTSILPLVSMGGTICRGDCTLAGDGAGQESHIAKQNLQHHLRNKILDQ